MRKLVLFMHCSLDGFVAGPAGEMDWIHVDEELFEYAGDQTDRSDTALYGRVTYQMMESYWPTAADQPGATKHDKQHSAWYNKVPKLVLSGTLKGKDILNVQVISSDLHNQVMKHKQAAGKDIVIFGSPGASHSLMQEGLIDEFWLFVNPVLLGKGIPLFSNIQEKTQLKLVTTKTFTSGVVCMHYEKLLLKQQTEPV